MKRQMPSTKEIEREIQDRVKSMFRKDFEEATKEEIYRACAEVVNDVVIDNWLTTQKEFNKQDPKCVYYMSMEFLIGRLLGNNMINMRGYTEVMDALDALGIDINEKGIEDAKETYKNKKFSFYQVDVEKEDFLEDMKNIMKQENIF